MDACIQPDTYVIVRTPSGLHRVILTTPNLIISLGKFGSFNTNDILDRPFHVTFEIREKGNDGTSGLRIVPSEELHADVLFDDPSSAESRDDAGQQAADGTEVVEHDGKITVRNNRQTVDDSSRQTLTTDEIEELKRSAVGSGKDIVTKIMESHSAISEKTAYSLAKYIVRKSKKYIKRFTVFPLDVSRLCEWHVNEKDPPKILDVREETLGLVASWANVHCSGPHPAASGLERKAGRWLLVEDAGGLFVALMAERMGILTRGGQDDEPDALAQKNEEGEDQNDAQPPEPSSPRKRSHPYADGETNGEPPKKKPRQAPEPALADHNSITMIHSASQPNLSLLSYYNYDANASTSNVTTDSHDHPLYNHLKTLSWLQLLHPEEDTAYMEPDSLTDDQLQKLKSTKRGAYYRKRRRWERAKQTIDETRAGGFDGLVVATPMDLALVMHHLVPLLSGGAPVVVYSPNIEPLMELIDMYSSARKTAFINEVYENDGEPPETPSEDYPVDPRWILAPSLQTARAREWQVLPGRTHPLMTSLGGPEGYVFTGTRAIPAEERTEARGTFVKRKRKVDGAAEDSPTTPL